LGMGTALYNDIQRFTFWPTNYEMVNTTFYLDDVRFAKGTVSYQSPARSVAHIDTNYAYTNDGYSSDPLKNLKIPGAPATPDYGSGPAQGYATGSIIPTSPSTPTTTDPFSSSGSVQSDSGSSPASWVTPLLVVLGLLFVGALVVAVVFVVKFKKAKELV